MVKRSFNRVKFVEIEFKEKLVNFNCVVKVIKGGCIFSFVVIVVVGDGNGIVGYGLGKVCDVFEVIFKVVDDVKKNFVKVLLYNGMIFYE